MYAHYITIPLVCQGPNQPVFLVLPNHSSTSLMSLSVSSLSLSSSVGIVDIFASSFEQNRENQRWDAE